MSDNGTCSFKVEITNLSYIEMKEEKFYSMDSKKNTKYIQYVRNINEIYHADVEIKNKFLTKETLSTSKTIVIETINAASEFIKIDDIKSAQIFMSMKLYKDYLKHGFKTAEVPSIDIIKTHNTGEWIDVVFLLPVA